MVKQISKIVNQRMYTMFEEFHLQTLLIHRPAGIHLPESLTKQVMPPNQLTLPELWISCRGLKSDHISIFEYSGTILTG
jgi:hypothetical protein